MKRLWMHTLTGQLIAIMLLALVLSYAITFVISHNERERALYEIRREDCLSRTTAIASLLLNSPESLRTDILRSINSPFNRFWITASPPGTPLEWQVAARERLLAVKVRTVHPEGAAPAADPASDDHALFDLSDLPDASAQWEPITVSQRDVTFEGQFVKLDSWNGMGTVLNLRDGHYVNAVTAKPRELGLSNFNLYASFAISAFTLSLASVLVARQLGRPLRRLSDMADRVGRGEDPGELPQEGAQDIRGTAIALNRMQARLRRFVEDRTNMIAAISHDLRTPITSLRLRAEFIKDPEMRDKIIATLEELQGMVDATLVFAREDSQSGASRVTDLGSLVASVCDDLAEMGQSITFEEVPRVTLSCRPEALKRAVRNVVENATRYGTRARVHIAQDREHLDIVVDDDGPGIPEAEHERVFAPFVRLESSRCRDTGGVGLGLSIARTIVHAHGGEVLLFNRPEGGLRVCIRLPSPR